MSSESDTVMAATRYPATEEEEAGKHKEGLRKKSGARVSSEVQCPVCTLTLRPASVEQHFKQELERARDPYKRKRKPSLRASQHSEDRHSDLLEKSRSLADAVKRRRFLFQHGSHDVSHDQPGPSWSSEGGSRKCPVCDEALATDEESASRHVSQCLQSQAVSSDSEEESYEEYTWCNVTRVRATSLLSPHTRAQLLNGTVVSRQEGEGEGEGGTEDVVDVELDTSVTYGPSQFRETDLISSSSSSSSGTLTANEEGPTPPLDAHQSEHRTAKTSPQCLICMDVYTQPLVSVQCWHVFCERCWLQALGAQKLCPKCKTITCAGDLRRIFL